MIFYNLVESRNLKTGEPQFYAMMAPVNDFVTLEEIAKEIDSSTTLTPADMLAVTSALNEVMTRALMSGHSVRLGLLGSFAPKVKSKATRRASEFTANNIKGLKIKFTPTATLKYQLSGQNPEVKFQRIIPA